MPSPGLNPRCVLPDEVDMIYFALPHSPGITNLHLFGVVVVWIAPDPEGDVVMMAAFLEVDPPQAIVWASNVPVRILVHAEFDTEPLVPIPVVCVFGGTP